MFLKKINFLKKFISFNIVDIFSVKRTFCRNQHTEYLKPQLTLKSNLFVN